jgi:hypothetical protein
MPASGIMIAAGQENDRFGQALEEGVLRRELMAEYARKSKLCRWVAALQAGIALVVFFVPGNQNAHWLFVCVALCFLILCLRSRRDLKLLKLADQQQAKETPPIPDAHRAAETHTEAPSA